MPKYRITQSLLSAWKYSYLTDDGFASFIDCLTRKPKPQTKAMLDGIQFENCVNSVLDGNPIDENHIWHDQVVYLSGKLHDSAKQVTIYKDVKVDGVPFLLHGVLDFLRNSIIYDTKFSTTYKINKYYDSPQHPMYFALVPEATEFNYLICDGKYVYEERYYPDDVEPIERTIKHFMEYLDHLNLVDTYVKHWKANENG